MGKPIPIRNVAKAGIVVDQDPYDLSLQSLSYGQNLRCENGYFERGPVARSSGAPLPRDPKLALCFDYEPGVTRVHVVDEYGYVRDWSTSGQTDLSPTAGWTGSVSDAPVTTTVLADVVYVNRGDRQPWYRHKRAASSTPYALLSSFNSGLGGAQFPSTLRFKSLRACAGLLVGIGVNDNGTALPTQVYWSDFADQDKPPRNWDTGGIVYNNAGETQSSVSGRNVLTEMKGSLIDGCPLGNNLVLYSSREAFLMSFVGGNDVFTFSRLFDGGILGVNCVVEHEGRHFCFGEDDIFVHDGNTTKISIAQGRVRNHIYRNLVRSEAHHSFVAHNKSLNEILFAYCSNDRYTTFPYTPSGTDRGCNRAAVFNYASNCWYFYDLPWVTSATFGQVVNGLTFSSVGSLTYDALGGSYASQGSLMANALLIASRTFKSPIDGSVQQPQLRSFGPPDDANTSATLDIHANGKMLAEKTRADFDELEFPIYGTKLFSHIDIQGQIAADARPVLVTVGASNHSTEEPMWGLTQTFDTKYSRIDCNQTGRYLAFKFEYDDYKSMRISSFDLDVQIVSPR